MVALVGVEDPVRESVPPAIVNCNIVLHATWQLVILFVLIFCVGDV